MHRVLLYSLIATTIAGCGGGGGGKAGEAAGLIDPSFETKGLALVPGVAGAIDDILELPDGSLLIAGAHGFVAKLKADGTLEPAFAGGGIDMTRRGSAVTQSTVQLAPFPQGAITVIEIHSSPCTAGGFCVDWFGDVVARRMDEDGIDDHLYGVGGLATLRVARGSVVVSADGRVTSYANRPGRYGSFFEVQSLDAAGNADRLFAQRAYDSVRSCTGSVLPHDYREPQVVATSAGDMTVVAASWLHSGLCVVRLDAQGAPDATFAFQGRRGIRFDQLPDSQLPLLAVLVRSDGDIVVVLAPKTRTTSGPIMIPAFLFFSPNGDLASITSRPEGIPTFMIDAVLQSNGKVVSVGFPAVESDPAGIPAGLPAPQIWRSNPTASAHDASFGPLGAGYNTIVSGELALLPEKVVVDRAGRILVVGSDASTNQPAVMRFR